MVSILGCALAQGVAPETKRPFRAWEEGSYFAEIAFNGEPDNTRRLYALHFAGPLACGGALWLLVLSVRSPATGWRDEMQPGCYTVALHIHALGLKIDRNYRNLERSLRGLKNPRSAREELRPNAFDPHECRNNVTAAGPQFLYDRNLR